MGGVAIDGTNTHDGVSFQPLRLRSIGEEVEHRASGDSSAKRREMRGEEAEAVAVPGEGKTKAGLDRLLGRVQLDQGSRWVVAGLAHVGKRGRKRELG